MHLFEERLVDVRDSTETLPGERKMRGLDRLSELERALVVEGEEVVRHPDVVVTELCDLTHLGHDRCHRPCAEEVTEHRFVAEVAAERTAACRHQWSRRVLPVLAP